MRLALLLCLLTALTGAYGQRVLTIHGTVTDAQSGQPVEFASVVIRSSARSVYSSQDGTYTLTGQVKPGDQVLVRRTGYDPQDIVLPDVIEGDRYELQIRLVPVTTDVEVIVTDRRMEDAGMVREKVDAIKLLPSTTGNLEALLPHIALGASSGTGGELTSQYNVRGGNYDENLVYVNDFEIYRPLLIRTGNQEGLTFANPDLIRDISFSSGAFEARFGDKMSSVLDVRYKMPDSLRGSFGLGMLGASAHIEGSLPVGKDGYRKWRYLAGFRYKTNAYLLGTLDVEGEYSPSFTDYQIYTTYDLSRDWQVGLLANLNLNRYDFIPVSSTTASGLITFALRLSTQFQGAEADVFRNGMGGVSLSWVPAKARHPAFVKLLLSGYRSYENETYDIIGSYRLSQIETDINDPDAGEEVALLGQGTQHTFSRNRLLVNVLNTDLRAGMEFEVRSGVSHFVQAGLRVGYETVDDRIHEWERLDSAGYSLPYDPEGLDLRYTLDSRRDLASLRYSGFLQNTYTHQYGGGREMRVTVGVRGNYWDLTREMLFSPRIQWLYAPSRHTAFRFATGLYMQPGFYRELRRPDGTINESLRAQKSYQVLAGYSTSFGPPGSSGPKYKLIVEGYYKSLWDLVSYEVDNVRIRYSGENDASGYVVGLDMRLNGELVPGAESWVNLSFLRAREKLLGVQHLKREEGQVEGVPVKDVPRPTDQFMTLSVFFQDYFPNNDNFRVHMMMGIGTGLPFGIKDNNTIYRNTYRFKPYHRVDIGFSTRLWTRAWAAKGKHSFLGFSRETWLSLEIFNLLNVRNEASRTWIKTVFEAQYAIPNYLTSRRLNIRFRCDF